MFLTVNSAVSFVLLMFESDATIITGSTSSGVNRECYPRTFSRVSS
jgi:hypothetical protein